MSIVAFTVCVGIRGPIRAGEYRVREKLVHVSYPASANLGGIKFDLPKSLSTVFVVCWEDDSGTVTKQLLSKSFDTQIPLYEALDAISEILLAFKLVRVGHLDGRGLRTVGIGDTLYFYSSIDGAQAGPLNTSIKNYEGNNAWASGNFTVFDSQEATELATPHVGTNTYPIARRYVRCFELVEHGFYSEAFIVAFSVLDDFVQQTLHTLLQAKGLILEGERNELIRGIKENRLKLFLGPLLKLAFGRDIESLWAGSTKALKWLNETRNGIAHRAEKVDYATAIKGIYACLKVLVVLNESRVASVELNVELFRNAKFEAANTLNVPDWVPRREVAERMDFSS
jgi:hypothetical protein